MNEVTLPPGSAELVAALTLWIQNITARIAAIEALASEKLNISDAEWRAALEKADHAIPPIPSPPLEEWAVVLADFVRRCTRAF
jgi:hypothetical protein